MPKFRCSFCLVSRPFCSPTIIIGRPSKKAEPQTIADGTRTLSVGKHNWELLKDGLETIVEVPEDAIREAVRLLFFLANLKAEPTGALGVAALLTSPETFRDRRVCCVITGGNVDAAVYAGIIAG